MQCLFCDRLTVLSLIKSLYCSCSNNYRKRYNHDASSDVNDRSEPCLSSSELYTIWLSNLPIGPCVQMASHSLARHGISSELFHHKILSPMSPINIYEISHDNQNVSLIYHVNYFAHLLFSNLGIFQSTSVCSLFCSRSE